MELLNDIIGKISFQFILRLTTKTELSASPKRRRRAMKQSLTALLLNKLSYILKPPLINPGRF